MKTKNTNIIGPKKNVARVALVVVGILLIPLVLSLLNPSATINGGKGGGWDWGPGDFVIMGILLFVTGLALDFAVRKLKDPMSRLLTCSAIIFALLVIWVELAVDGVSKLVAFLLGKPF
jgi:hypothetical protein